MSHENVELVERAIAALNARDIERYLACCTEDIKLETPMAAVGGATKARRVADTHFWVFSRQQTTGGGATWLF
jgi:hypothetical protein